MNQLLKLLQIHFQLYMYVENYKREFRKVLKKACMIFQVSKHIDMYLKVSKLELVIYVVLGIVSPYVRNLMNKNTLARYFASLRF